MYLNNHYWSTLKTYETIIVKKCILCTLSFVRQDLHKMNFGAKAFTFMNFDMQTLLLQSSSIRYFIAPQKRLDR